MSSPLELVAYGTVDDNAPGPIMLNVQGCTVTWVSDGNYRIDLDPGKGVDDKEMILTAFPNSTGFFLFSPGGNDLVKILLFFNFLNNPQDTGFRFKIERCTPLSDQT